MFISEVESLRVQSLWLLKKTLPSREEPDISLSIVNSKARFIPMLYAHIISPKHISTLNTCSSDFICKNTEFAMSRKRQNRYRSHCEG